MQKEDPDWKIIRAVQQGNRQAYNVLVVKYQYRVMKLVSRYVYDQQEAKDITQETFIKAYRALGSFRGDSAFYTWIYRIAVNTAKNFIMARNRRGIETDVDMVDLDNPRHLAQLSEGGTPEEMLQKDEVEKAVYTAIDDLPSELKTAITLRELDGLSYEEIAEVMSCPVGTVRSRIFRAREAIETRIRGL